MLPRVAASGRQASRGAALTNFHFHFLVSARHLHALNTIHPPPCIVQQLSTIHSILRRAQLFAQAFPLSSSALTTVCFNAALIQRPKIVLTGQHAQTSSTPHTQLDCVSLERLTFVAFVPYLFTTCPPDGIAKLKESVFVRHALLPIALTHPEPHTPLSHTRHQLNHSRCTR